MVINATTTIAPWQEHPKILSDQEGEQGIYWVSNLYQEGTGLDIIQSGTTYRIPERHPCISVENLMARGSNRDISIEFKCFDEHFPRHTRERAGRDTTTWPDRGAIQEAAGYYTDWFASRAEPDILSGLCVFAPESSRTSTPDILISHFYRAETPNHLLQDILRRSAEALSVGISHSLYELKAQIERTRRHAEMEKLLRGFSELPENWDSYGGSPIAAEIIAEARQFLAAGINLDLPPAWAAPGGDGGIGIQWDTDRTELYIDIVPGEETTYALTSKVGDRVDSEGVLTMANLSEVLSKLAESAA